MSKPLSEAVEDGASCPRCGGNGLVTVAVFGAGATREVWAWCEGLDGDRDSGCGWEEVYQNDKKS